MYVIGSTGSGKTTLLLNMIGQDLREGGVCVLDPHGDLAQASLGLIPPDRRDDLLWLDPTSARPVAYNPLSRVPEDDRPRVADNITSAMRHVWHDSWGPRMEHILVNSLRTLLDADMTLLALPRLLTDDGLRREVTRKVRDPQVRAFWFVEFGQWDQRFRQEAVSPILNKAGRLLAAPAMRNILAQRRSTLDLRRILDDGRILIISLAKGKLGEENAHLLGALVVSGIVQAALSRADVPESERAPFHIYVDEFQSFATKSFEVALSESRKYGLALCLANQFCSQLPESLQQAVLGNIGNVVAFRVGGDDAPVIGRHIDWQARELQDLSNFHAVGKFLVGGNPTQAMPLETLPPPQPVNHRVAAMVRHSQIRFGRDRKGVEASVEKFLNPRPRRRAPARPGSRRR